MFCEGEYVVYGTNGVCRVGEITTVDIHGISKDRKYYVLFPKNRGGKIYVPVDKGDAKMRKVITKAEAKELIRRMPSIEPIEVSNEKLLEEIYKKCAYCYDCTEWIRLIKCIYDRKQSRLSDGKKITSTDEKYMHMAEEVLYSELGIALDIPQEQVLDYILNEVKTDKTKER